jgi:plastocyanin
VTAQGGKDTGRLASAVKAAGGGTAVEKGGVISIPADPSGQLAFADAKATGTAGAVTIEMPNKSGTQHDIVIDGLGKGPIVASGTSSFKATLDAGKTYTYYCSVPGHRAAGMQGTLTVKSGRGAGGAQRPACGAGVRPRSRSRAGGPVCRGLTAANRPTSRWRPGRWRTTDHAPRRGAVDATRPLEQRSRHHDEHDDRPEHRDRRQQHAECRRLGPKRL